MLLCEGCSSQKSWCVIDNTFPKRFFFHFFESRSNAHRKNGKSQGESGVLSKPRPRPHCLFSLVPKSQSGVLDQCFPLTGRCTRWLFWLMTSCSVLVASAKSMSVQITDREPFWCTRWLFWLVTSCNEFRSCCICFEHVCRNY